MLKTIHFLLLELFEFNKLNTRLHKNGTYEQTLFHVW